MFRSMLLCVCGVLYCGSAFSQDGMQIGQWFMKRSTSVHELVLEKDGQERRFKWNDLKETQLSEVAKAFALRDKEQFDIVQPHLAALYDNPKSVSETLKRIHVQLRESPYAGLWAAVAESAGLNNTKEADKLLSEVKRRIEIQQKANPVAHQQTLASTFNNLAVCEVKQGNGNTAANYLVSALKVNQSVTPIFARNVNQLLAVPEGAKMALNREAKQKLSKALSISDLKAIDAKTQSGWQYSLDFDIPDGSSAARRIEGIEPPMAGMELMSIGTGVVMADGIVVTAKRNIEQLHAPVVTVAYPKGRSWDTRVARSILYEGSRATIESGSAGVVGNQVVFMTNFKVISPNPGSPAAEVAALHVGSIPIKPALTAKRSPESGAVLTLKNYSRSVESIADGLFSKNAAVKSVGPVIEVTDLVDGGAIGGVLVDEANAVVGLVYDFEGDVSAKAFNISQVRDWFRRNVKTTELKTDDGTAKDTNDSAIVLVMSWAFRPRTLFSALTDSSKPSGQMFLVDSWCLSCDGKGFHKCTTCKGTGVAIERRQEVTGFDPKIGPIVSGRQYTHACPTCNGNRFFKCQACVEGRLHP